MADIFTVWAEFAMTSIDDCVFGRIRGEKHPFTCTAGIWLVVAESVAESNKTQRAGERAVGEQSGKEYGSTKAKL